MSKDYENQAYFKIINATTLLDNNTIIRTNNLSNVVLGNVRMTNLSVINTNITFGNGASNGATIYWQKLQCNSTCICEYLNQTIISRNCFG